MYYVTLKSKCWREYCLSIIIVSFFIETENKNFIMRSFERCKYLTKLMTSIKVDCKNEFSKQNFIYKY